MKTVSIILKELKQNLRNWKANLMMILFPILLILILGTAFSGVFDNSISFGDVKVLYTVEGDEKLEEGFRAFAGHIGDKLGIVFERTADREEGINSIKDVKYTCYVLFDGKPGEVRLYKNKRYNFEANFVEGLVGTFVQGYNAYAEIAKENPAVLGRIAADAVQQESFVKTTSIDGKTQAGALDYYAVTMLTLILMYSALTGMWSFRTEVNYKTINRLLCSPVSRQQILFGKVIGSIAVTILQGMVVIGFSKFVLKADWGNDFGTILLIVAALAVMTVSLGTAAAFLMKNDGAASSAINVLIPIFVFLGGGYTPIENMGRTVGALSVVSPLRWVNRAIFRVIYDSDYSLVPTAVFINLAAAAVFISLSALLSRKEVA